MVNGELELRRKPAALSKFVVPSGHIVVVFCVLSFVFQSSLSQLCIHLMLSLHLDTCALRLAQVCEKKSPHTFMVAEPLL